MPLKILALSRYAALGASSRVRQFQYVPYLESAGAEVVISPFFDDAYLRRLYSARTRRLRDLLRAYIRRFRAVLSTKSFHVAWVQKELFPYLPASIEDILARKRIPYVLDLDDAVFHTYDEHRSPLIRAFLAAKFHRLISHAHHVVVGNNYLESYARECGAKTITRIPTVVDLNRYQSSEEPEEGEFRVGWIGSPETTKYIYLVREALRALSRRRPIRLVTVGALPLSDFDVPLEQHAWSESEETALLHSFHVGIMPLPDNSWERGKCGYKIVQYMACGRPVVASPVGVNREMVTTDVGSLAATTEDWVSALDDLALDRDRRVSLGRAARAVAEREYSLEIAAPRMLKILQTAAGN